MRFGLFACVAAAPTLVAASEPMRIQPSGPWVLDYAENSCRLSRTFGDGDLKTTMVLESPTTEQLDMLIIGKPLRTDAERIAARFLPIGGKPFTGLTAKTATSRHPATLWSRVHLLPDEAIDELDKEAAEWRPGVRPQPTSLSDKSRLRTQRLQFAAEATSLEIQVRRNRPVVLETGSMGEPIKLFDQCIRDSMKSWGIDPDLEDKIVRPVWAPDLTKWMSSDDYPADMAWRGEESVVSVRLLIDASGRVTKCTSLSHFKEPEFNRITCATITERAQFAPAELSDGTKVPSYYSYRVMYRMPQ